MNLLQKKIRDFLASPSSGSLSGSLSLIGENALASFLSLPEIETWAPKERLAWHELSTILQSGLIFTLLEDNSSVRKRKRDIVKAIKLTNNLPGIPKSEWSEIKIGALLSYLGGRITFINKNSFRTPDLQLEFRGISVDVEVVHAEMRWLEKKVRDGLNNFIRALQPGDVQYNLICFFADASNQMYLSDALDASITLRPGGSKEAIWKMGRLGVPCRRTRIHHEK